MTDEKDLFLGIDPGASSGGLAILDSHGAIVDASKMPETEKDISDYFKEFAPRLRFAYIERVHSMPKQGVSSSFKFGVNYGALRMALLAHEIPFESIPPQRWQKVMNCMTGGQKNVSKAKAQELFPGHRITHSIADSLLIAECCRRLTIAL